MSDSEITDDPDRQSRWRLPSDLTWFPSEFSKLRLEYNHDILEDSHFLGGRDAVSVAEVITKMKSEDCGSASAWLARSILISRVLQPLESH